MPSAPYSFSPHSSQKVEESLNVHRLPAAHGLSLHSATDDATAQTAVRSSEGLSMVVFVTRSDLAAVTDRDVPLGASLERKTESLITAVRGPVRATAPPSPELTLNS